MDIEKAIILDSILQRFNGNTTVYWDKLRKEFTNNGGQLTRDFFILENNIKYLLGEGALQRDSTTTGDALCLTDKGFAIFADLEKLGYTKRAKTERNEKRLKNVGFIIAILTFAILIYKTFIR